MPKITRRKRLGRRPKRSKSPGVDTEVEGGVEVEGLDADADADADADVDAEGLDADADVDAVPIVADAVPINEEGGGEGGGSGEGTIRGEGGEQRCWY